MRRIVERVTHPFRPPVIYDKHLGPNNFLEAQPDLFVSESDGSEIMSRVDRIASFDGDKETAGQLLESFHVGAMLVARSIPSIVRPTPLWMEIGAAPTPIYVFPAGEVKKPAVVITTNILGNLSKLPQNEALPLPADVEQGSYDDLGFTPNELMLPAGVEEAHHAIVARHIGLKYGDTIGAVRPDSKELYMAQEVEWQAARFVLEALRIQNVSPEAISAHQRRLAAAEGVRKLVGLENKVSIPYFDDFMNYHDKS